MNDRDVAISFSVVRSVFEWSGFQTLFFIKNTRIIKNVNKLKLFYSKSTVLAATALNDSNFVLPTRLNISVIRWDLIFKSNGESLKKIRNIVTSPNTLMNTNYYGCTLHNAYRILIIIIIIIIIISVVNYRFHTNSLHGSSIWVDIIIIGILRTLWLVEGRVLLE